ncbi:1119_t:CDS:2 [Ambispora leptoticha]|uniref:1119_t:CDS:1 n=1 Tax=Ambispora leptoticha TaxID=144679 RepID=A0A9N9C884_9GLOM|nr:1119_t:CDS:2 [Ambispora leptoticha]
MPKYYRDLMIRCWAQDPLKRPTANEILNTIGEWNYLRLQNEFKKSIENRKRRSEIHEGAIYKSKSISKTIEATGLTSTAFLYRLPDDIYVTRQFELSLQITHVFKFFK